MRAQKRGIKNGTGDLFPRLLFYILLLLNLIPALRFSRFVTLDGPAHCYNTHILSVLWGGSDSFYDAFFRVNPYPVPNYLGHILLMGLHQLFTWATSEKILSLLFLAGLPVLFRKTVLLLQPANSWWSLIIFPFTWYLFTYYGFYNFNLGLLLLFYGIYYRLKHVHLNYKRLFVMFLLSVLLYFSHVFTCLCYFMFIGFYELFSWRAHRNKSLFISRSLKLFVVAAPGLAMCMIYFLKNPSTGENDMWTFAKVTGFYFSAEYLKIFNLDSHWYYNAIAWALVITCIISMGMRFRHVFAKTLNPANATLLMLFICMTVCAYILPNTSGNAGYITYRFIFLAVLFMLWYLGSVVLHPYLTWCCVGLCSICYGFMQWENGRGQEIMQKEYTAVCEAAPYIENKSIVAPFFFNRYGFTGNFSAYLADEKDLILLDNYEASTNYFPVRWDTTKLPAGYFCDSMAVHFTPYFPHSNMNTATSENLLPDYIFINGTDSTQADYKQLLRDINPAFSLIYSNNSVSLYKKNKTGPCKSL